MKNKVIFPMAVLALSLPLAFAATGGGASFAGVYKISADDSDGDVAEKRVVTDKDGFLLDKNGQYPKINGRKDYRYKYENGKVVAYRPSPGGPEFGFEIDKTYDELRGTKPEPVWE